MSIAPSRPAAVPHTFTGHGSEQHCRGSGHGTADREPGAVVRIGLPPWHILVVNRIRQHQLKVALAQKVPHRFSGDPGCLYRDLGPARDSEPFRRRQLFFRGHPEASHPTLDRAIHRDPFRRDDRVARFRQGRFLHIQAGAMRTREFHLPSCRYAPTAWVPEKFQEPRSRALSQLA